MSSTMDCRLGVTLAEGVSEWGFAGGVEGHSFAVDGVTGSLRRRSNTGVIT